MSSFENFLKKSKKAGKFLKLNDGEARVYELNCTPRDIEPKEGKYGEAVEIKLTDIKTDEKKLWNVKKYSILEVLAKCEEGDQVKISKDEDGKWHIKAKGGKSDEDESDDDSEDDEEDEETPKKKKKVVEEEDEEETEEDEDDEDEAPKKKKSKKSSDDEDEEEEVEDDEDEAPKKKKKKSKKSSDDDDEEVNPDDIDF